MAWTVPMTAVVGLPWSAADFNAGVRDNLLETFPGKATAANRMCVTTGPNAVAERVPDGATVATSQTTASTTYADLATSGPAVTVTTGVSAVVWFAAEIGQSDAASSAIVSVAVSGATTRAASDSYRIQMHGPSANQNNRFGVCRRFGDLTAGSNTFTMKYRVTGDTGTFARRHIIVLPL